MALNTDECERTPFGHNLGTLGLHSFHWQQLYLAACPPNIIMV